MKRFMLSLVGFLVLSGSLCACPLCNTETGKQVREGIFGPDFGINVLLTLAPFPMLFGIIALIFWAIPDSQTKSN